MNTIFWTQNETPLIPSTLIIDGSRSEYEGNKLQNEAMKILGSTSDWKVIDYVNSSLKVKFKDDEGYLISSCFTDVDEAGRPMPFMFYSNATDFLSVVDELRDHFKHLNRTYNWSELDKSKCDEIIMKIDKKKGGERMIVKKWERMIDKLKSHFISDTIDPKNEDTMDLKNDSVKKTNDYELDK